LTDFTYILLLVFVSHVEVCFDISVIVIKELIHRLINE